MATAGTRVPKYWTVKGELLRLIGAGRPGDALPTERELAQRYDASRTTVRQAIAELVVEGRLTRTQGSGTYIAEPQLVQVHQLTSFTDDLGPDRVHNRLLRIGAEDVTEAVAERLELPAGARIHRVERLRLVDGSPLAHESACLARVLPGLDTELDRRGSLYATLREVYDIRIAQVEDAVQTRLADPDEAELLGVETGHPLLLVFRLGWDASGRPIEWTRSVYRGDRFRYIARARRVDPR